MKKNRRPGSKGNVNIPAAPVVKAMEVPAAAPSEEMILQFGDLEVAAADISEKAKQDYKNSENDAVFYIVSRDTGFDCLVEFWKERNIKVKRIVNFLEEDEDQQSAPKQTDTDQKKKQKNESKVSDDNKVTKEELLQYLTEEEYSDRILEIFNSYKTKVAINNGLSKEFRDNQKSGAIYKKLKVLLKEKKKS